MQSRQFFLKSSTPQAEVDVSLARLDAAILRARKTFFAGELFKEFQKGDTSAAVTALQDLVSQLEGQGLVLLSDIQEPLASSVDDRIHFR